MFCTSCGKEIINTARFCNYCGKPVQNFAPTASSPISSPISSPVSAPYSAPVPETNAERYASEDVLSGGIGSLTQNTEEPADGVSVFPKPEASEPSMPETNSTIPDTSAANADIGIPSSPAQQMPTVGAFSTGSAYPMPNVIPQSGTGVSGTNSAFAGGTSVTAVPSKPERERKYTLGHILLCLASTAVMAITAGVFAGLYFSVV